jgi:hypothetical protein
MFWVIETFLVRDIFLGGGDFLVLWGGDFFDQGHFLG